MTDKSQNVGDKRRNLQRLSLFALIVALELLLFFTPLGFVPVGPLNLTTLHLPVILASVILGTNYGALAGFIFALLSFLKNTFAPSLTSFVFSPFVSFAEVGGNVWSLVICFVPRIILGIAPVLFMKLQEKFVPKEKYKQALSAAIAALLSTILHTVMVLSGIYIFFAEPYAEALSVAVEAVLGMLGLTVITNGIIEAILAAIFSFAFAKVYFEYMKKFKREV